MKNVTRAELRRCWAMNNVYKGSVYHMRTLFETHNQASVRTQKRLCIPWKCDCKHRMTWIQMEVERRDENYNSWDKNNNKNNNCNAVEHSKKTWILNQLLKI